jgi:hypothetical protein
VRTIADESSFGTRTGAASTEQVGDLTICGSRLAIDEPKFVVVLILPSGREVTALPAYLITDFIITRSLDFQTVYVRQHPVV